MEDQPGVGAPRGARRHLEHAARIRGGDDIRPYSGNVAGLPVAELPRGVGLHEVINPGAAAADLLFREGQDLDAGNRRQEIAWRLADALRVGEVTRVVIGDA